MTAATVENDLDRWSSKNLDRILDEGSLFYAADSEIQDYVYLQALEMPNVLLYNNASIRENYIDAYAGLFYGNNELPFYNLLYALQEGLTEDSTCDHDEYKAG